MESRGAAEIKRTSRVNAVSFGWSQRVEPIEPDRDTPISMLWYNEPEPIVSSPLITVVRTALSPSQRCWFCWIFGAGTLRGILFYRFDTVIQVRYCHTGSCIHEQIGTHSYSCIHTLRQSLIAPQPSLRSSALREEEGGVELRRLNFHARTLYCGTSHVGITRKTLLFPTYLINIATSEIVIYKPLELLVLLIQ